MNAVKTNPDFVNREFPEVVDQITEWALNILQNGPTRVLKGWKGLTPDAAAKDGVFAEYVLIRHDGWSIGYKAEDEARAEDLWAGEWVALLNLLTGEVDFLNAT